MTHREASDEIHRTLVDEFERRFPGHVLLDAPSIPEEERKLFEQVIIKRSAEEIARLLREGGAKTARGGTEWNAVGVGQYLLGPQDRRPE